MCCPFFMHLARVDGPLLVLKLAYVAANRPFLFCDKAVLVM